MIREGNFHVKTRSVVMRCSISLMLVMLTSGSRETQAEPAELALVDRELLIGVARDTWKSVTEMADATALPVDGLTRRDDGTWVRSAKTTPTDVGCYLWSVLAAEKLHLITRDDAELRLKRALNCVKGLKRVHGFFYDRLDPSDGSPLRRSPVDGGPIAQIVSCVDNGWLAVALVMVRNSCPSFASRSKT